MTKNTKLKVKVFMYDGDFTGWHSSNAPNLVQTAEVVIDLVHVPSVTRYDQYEIQQGNMYMQEGGVQSIAFSSAMSSGLGVGVGHSPGRESRVPQKELYVSASRGYFPDRSGYIIFMASVFGSDFTSSYFFFNDSCAS